MKQEKFKVLLYLKKSSPDKSGKTPIMGRITVGNSMSQFSCKLSCDPKLWNPRESRLNGKSKIAVETNAKLDKFLLSVNDAYGSLTSRNISFCAEDVRNLVQGIATTQMTLIKLLDRVYQSEVARVGIDRAPTTPPTYFYTMRCLKQFIKKKFKTEDIAFGQLNEQFIREFQDFALLKCGYSLDTVRHYLAILKKICKIAFREGFSEKCYFAYYKLPKQTINAPKSLSREQFEKIRDLEIEPHRTSHNLVRDMFIFSCYVGSAYIDTVTITKENLITNEDGAKWLRYNRNKNGSLSRVKLLPEALEIIEKYQNEDRDTLFPFIEYATLRANIQGIRVAIDMKENLSYHQSRHSFASLITLEQGVPIETVSKMLGHGDIRTTQIYARVTPKKLFEDMNKYIEATKDLTLAL